MDRLLLAVGTALGVSFVCSILEAVLLSVSQSYIAVLRDRGERAGALLERMREEIDEPIAAILTLNTIAHTVGAAMGGAIALEVFGSRWIAAFSAALTLAILIFSEILPKTLGATYWRLLARPTAHVLRVMILVMKPVLVPLALFNRLIAPRGRRKPKVSRAEIEVLAEIGRREGAIDEEEWRVVTNVMNLDQVRVGEVMTPRTQIVAVPVDASPADARRIMLEHGPLRLPVYEGSIDNVVGILLARDLWRTEHEPDATLRDVMRPPRFVPETKPVEDLIREMRSERIKMAIVVDEFGGTAGLVTLEDLIEEIVGEIQDEHEPAEPGFETLPTGETRMPGAMPIPEVNDRLGLELPDEAHDTIGGYVFGALGRLPQTGDEVRVAAGRLRVLAMDGRRIERLAFIPAAPRFAAGRSDARPDRPSRAPPRP